MTALLEPVEASGPVVSVRGLGKTYDLFDKPGDRLRELLLPGRRLSRPFQALKDVSFDVGRGEAVAVIGKNGSGKSTLLQVIAGVLRPSEGEVVLRGRVAALLELGSGFHPEFTGRENLYLNASLLGLSRAEVDSLYERIVGFAGIGDFIDQPIRTYSSGMVVRLAFALSAHVDADVIELDEALAVGDTAFQFRCLSRLEDLIARGTTLLLVTHDLQLAKAYCRRAVYLRSGRVAYDGDAETAVELYSRDLRAEELRSLPPSRETPEGATDQALRFGSGRGRIETVTMGTGADDCRQFRSGAPVWVETGVELHDQGLRRVRLTLVLRDIRAYNLFLVQSEISPASGLRGRFHFTCSLQSGDYSLTLKLEEAHGDTVTELLDKRNHALLFKVVEGERRFGGVVDLGGRFEALDGAA